MRAPHRRERMAREMVREVSTIVQQELSDPRLGFVSITRVEIGKDLRQAKVFFSVLGGRKERHLSLQALRAASGLIRRELGYRIRSPEIPSLEFVVDESVEKAFEITRLIDEVTRCGKGEEE